MKKAIKRRTRLQAWQLGQRTETEKRLVAEGKIIPREDGTYELFSQEATGEVGQIAQAGDYFKLDSTDHPYPNAREIFEAKHRRIEGDWYEQIVDPVQIWTADDPECEEINFLVASGQLTIRPDDSDHYYSAMLWGTRETAARDAVVVFYEVRRDADGRIEQIDFNFVERGEFEKTYERLTD